MGRLLFQEDLADKRDLVRHLLAREGWSASRAPAEDLMAVTVRLRPDVVVFSEASIDPWQLVDELHADEELRETRFVLVTDSEMDASAREALFGAGVRVLPNAHVDYCLPATIAELIGAGSRATHRARIVLEVQGRNDAGVFYGHSIDLSTGGLRMESSHRFEVGDHLYCFFALADPAPVVFATARVLRAEQTSTELYEYGLRFVDIRLEDRRRIAEIVLPEVASEVAALAS